MTVQVKPWAWQARGITQDQGERGLNAVGAQDASQETDN
jgi:hypothetical protein